MDRFLYRKLVAWKDNKNRKPLIVRGARQVGKTWLMQHFAQAEFKHHVYLNFEGNPRLQAIFSQDFEIGRILKALEIESGKTIDNNTLLIFDEIQDAPGALASLKYFNENKPGLAIMTAGSLLGVTLHQETSFPVGKVEFLDLHPLSFPEFLLAVSENSLLKLLEENDWNMVRSFRDKYINLLRLYYFVGGMPEAVRAFSTDRNFEEVRTIQKNILTSYENDFSKHAPVAMVPRLRMLWNSIPSQLAKENRKFVYSHIREGARAREFEMAMTWLINCGLLHKVSRVTKPNLPLKAYEDQAAFKLFIGDVGLLGAMVNMPAKTLLEGNALFVEFRGALTEQYVLQQLVTHTEWDVFYWSADNAQAEIDFMLQVAGQIISLEVKAEENLKAKSLRVVHDTFKPNVSIRTSLSDYRKEDWMLNLPLYAIHELAM